MIAAVAAVLASAQFAATTEISRQTGAAGSAVRGSRMWWNMMPPRRQRRATAEEIARPPLLIATTVPGPAPPGSPAAGHLRPAAGYRACP